jgi:hypothetical protein
LEYWSIGVLEYWSIGVKVLFRFEFRAKRMFSDPELLYSSAQLDIGVASVKKVPIPLQRILTAQSLFMNPVSQNRDSFPGKFSYSAFSKELDLLPTRALDEVISLTAEEMARASRLVTSAYNELLQVAASLEDQAYRRLMTECIASPKITFLDLYPTPEDRKQIFAEMVGLGFFNPSDSADEVFPANPRSPQTYLTAPSSHNDFYNAHPGGLAVTVAYNVRMAEAYTANYRQMYGLPINRDLPSAFTNIQKSGCTNGRRMAHGRRSLAQSTMIPGMPIVSTSPLSCYTGDLTLVW